MDKPIEGAVLFADVSGSTKLYDTVGDKLAFAAVQSCVNAFIQVTEANGGRVIKTIGDEVMAIFPNGNVAAAAAIEMQHAVERLEPTGGQRLGARIGFHFGPAIERDGDVFGDMVNLAARLCSAAKGMQILLSEHTWGLVQDVFEVRELEPISPKGIAQPVRVFEVLRER